MKTILRKMKGEVDFFWGKAKFLSETFHLIFLDANSANLIDWRYGPVSEDGSYAIYVVGYPEILISIQHIERCGPQLPFELSIYVDSEKLLQFPCGTTREAEAFAQIKLELMLSTINTAI